MTENNENNADAQSSEPSDRWPNVGPEQLRELWNRFAPRFVKIDGSLDEALRHVKVPFLSWLESRGIRVDSPGFAGRVRTPLQPDVDRPGPRVRLEDVRFSRSGPTAAARVRVSLRGRQAEGSCRRDVVGDNLMGLPAEAALRAVQELLPVVDFDVENAFSIEGNDYGTADLAVVVARDPARLDRQRYVGACPIMGSHPEAGAKAALDAINRHAEIAAAVIDSLENGPPT